MTPFIQERVVEEEKKSNSSLDMSGIADEATDETNVLNVFPTT